jgi:hypothetical protein
MIISEVHDDSISGNLSLDKIRAQSKRYQYQELDFAILLYDNPEMPARRGGD